MTRTLVRALARVRANIHLQSRNQQVSKHKPQRWMASYHMTQTEFSADEFAAITAYTQEQLRYLQYKRVTIKINSVLLVAHMGKHSLMDLNTHEQVNECVARQVHLLPTCKRS